MKKYEFLRQIPLFEAMPDEDLRQMCESIDEIALAAGDILFGEGDTGDKVYIIQAGQLEILKQAGRYEVRLALRESGDVVGEMSLLEVFPRSATARAVTDCHLLALRQNELDILLTNSPTAARALLKTVTARLRATNSLLQESEKLAQLGTLSAGVAHELNNPAAAIVRSSEELLRNTSRLNVALLELGRQGITARQEEDITALMEKARARMQARPVVDALRRMDLESEMEGWLERHGAEQVTEAAVNLVETGFSPQDLEQAAERFPGESFSSLVNWLAAFAVTCSLLGEMKQGAAAITEIVKALKSYVYLDQGPVHAVDLKEGLENTLIVMRHKLKQGVAIHRDYDEQIPNILAYGGELNQVWTNLIDNAIDAMGGRGNLCLRTRLDDGFAVVEIEDDGPGIPDSIREMLFTPFFTTKPQGIGTGLGLSVSYNIIQKHNGMIEVDSRPGSTRFIVRLPLQGAA